jgi:hypothetical protein
MAHADYIIIQAATISSFLNDELKTDRFRK